MKLPNVEISAYSTPKTLADKRACNDHVTLQAKSYLSSCHCLISEYFQPLPCVNKVMKLFSSPTEIRFC